MDILSLDDDDTSPVNPWEIPYITDDERERNHRIARRVVARLRLLHGCTPANEAIADRLIAQALDEERA